MKNGDPSGEKVNRVEAAMEVITTELNELLLAYKAIHWQSYHFIIHPHFTFAEEMKCILLVSRKCLLFASRKLLLLILSFLLHRKQSQF